MDPDAASPEVTAPAEGSAVSAAAAGKLGNALDEVLASATIADAGGGDYYVKGDAAKKVVGTIRDIGRGVKATCYKHSRCNCWITSVPSHMHRVDVHVDLVKWLNSCNAKPLTEDEHWRASFAMRRDKYRMRVKG